ncbi:putative pentatricopeptide repeat-containing protein [Quercus suber]|uniref:Pentatricopeptide repeat-containing protein n=1 Tax=Quercus suber TaxID=58331 RepID=A0AAW0KC72_QUESU
MEKKFSMALRKLDMEAGLKVFEFIPKWNVLACTSLISVNVNKYGCAVEALNLLFDMLIVGFVPDKAIFLSAIGACAHLGAPALGQSIHAYILKTNNGADTFIGTALVDMYSKIGNAISAQEIFSKLERKDDMACAGYFEGAEKLVKKMSMQLKFCHMGCSLNGCEIHENVNLADQVSSRITELEPQGSGVFVLLSNIYARAGKWQEV